MPQGLCLQTLPWVLAAPCNIISGTGQEVQLHFVISTHGDVFDARRFAIAYLEKL